ncbi:lysophospholipase [Brachybacterium sp. HMSC06H03]|uniref:alpha/beta fold hydrolase n=1 Tax=Brachybacterium sp. HMSC06H03 TaxID=1581127 RepID=UPI0008A66054|nr:alpha/beta fold hydrolase [Brachybacterium sp. HMSC06H03]OFT61067.1 lysophospholipase [Brachybacterium sp. HMSC06H03]
MSEEPRTSRTPTSGLPALPLPRRIAPWARPVEIIERATQDELLQIRNDLMTVYREVEGEGPELFPLRYARATPRRPRRVRGADGSPPPESLSPEVPVLILPDGPARASVLPYDVLRRSLAARGVDVLMMEHRGVGFSRLDAVGEDLPARAITLREVVRDVLAVLDHAGVERAALVGTGYGAQLAQILAILHPERVHSLVLDSPRSAATDELVAQRRLRELYWDGGEATTSSTAAVLRRLAEEGKVEASRAGPVVLAVHEHGGPAAVRDLVDLLAVGRGSLTWSSVRKVLNRAWLESTPFVVEHDLVARLAHTELGYGAHADGGPLDPLLLTGEERRAVPPFAREPIDLHALAPAITAPTLVISGSQDLVSPTQVAREVAGRIPGAQLLEIRGAGHSMLDTRSRILQIAARWSACGVAHRLPEHAAELAALPVSATDRALSRGLQIALAAERHSPWRLRLESARAERERHLLERAQATSRGQRGRRTGTVREDPI